LIVLAFILPLALYLIVLGFLNRRHHPQMVSGVWDCVGLLFAASGFLLFGGPAILSGLNERWRMFWLLRRHGASVQSADGGWQFWVFLSILYFVVVVAGCAAMLWRRRRITAVYNAESRVVERALGQACDHLGLSPVRSGAVYLFGISLDDLVAGGRANIAGIQAPHYRPVLTVPPKEEEVLAETTDAAEKSLIGQAAKVLADQVAVLEVDSFPLLCHVTLRWDPASSPVRQEVENELARRLEHLPAPAHDVGTWLLTLGLGLLGFTMLAGCGLAVLNILQHLGRS
jgi:hypothetical protein